jgi:hypothetical protein
VPRSRSRRHARRHRASRAVHLVGFAAPTRRSAGSADGGAMRSGMGAVTSLAGAPAARRWPSGRSSSAFGTGCRGGGGAGRSYQGRGAQRTGVARHRVRVFSHPRGVRAAFDAGGPAAAAQAFTGTVSAWRRARAIA